MDKRFEGCFRGFQHYARMYYAGVAPVGYGAVDEVMFGLYTQDGASRGEVAMRWYDGAKFGEKVPVAHLEAFDDQWPALANMVDVVASLPEFKGKLLQPPEFCALLEHLGFQDRTQTENPHTTAPKPMTEAERQQAIIDKLTKALEEVRDGTDDVTVENIARDALKDVAAMNPPKE